MADNNMPLQLCVPPVTWPMKASDLALIQTSLLFSLKCELVSIRTT